MGAGNLAGDGTALRTIGCAGASATDVVFGFAAIAVLRNSTKVAETASERCMVGIQGCALTELLARKALLAGVEHAQSLDRKYRGARDVR